MGSSPVVKNITAPYRRRFSTVNTATSSVAVISKRGGISPSRFNISRDNGMTS